MNKTMEINTQYSRPLICISGLHDEAKKFIALLVKYTSGLRYNFNYGHVDVREARLCVEYDFNNYLGKRLLVDVKCGDREGGLNRVKLVEALSYSRLTPLSPIGEFSIANIVSRIIEEIAQTSKVTWAHTILKRNYQTIIQDTVKPILGTLSTSPLSSTLLILALLGGVHRLGLALRQVAAQHLLYDYLLKPPSSYTKFTDTIAKMLTSIIVDALAYLPIIVQLFKRGALGTELAYNVSAEPIATEITDKPREVLRRFKKYLDEEILLKHSMQLADILKKSAETNSILEVACNKLEALQKTLLGIEREIAREVLGIAIDGREALIGRSVMLSKKISEKLSHINFRPITLVITLTEQSSPSHIEFLRKLVEEELETRINKIIVLFTQLTLYNAQLILDYAKEKQLDLDKVRLVPVTSTDPVYNKVIAKKIASKEDNILAILQGSSTTVFSIASGLTHAKTKKIIIV